MKLIKDNALIYMRKLMVAVFISGCCYDRQMLRAG